MRKGLRKFEPDHWVVEALGHKLATHHPVIEPVSAAQPGTVIPMQIQARKSRLHLAEVFENTRLASTSDASSDIISSEVSARSRSATRRLAWRSRMRSSALRIERALENNGWALRSSM